MMHNILGIVMHALNAIYWSFIIRCILQPYLQYIALLLNCIKYCFSSYHSSHLLNMTTLPSCDRSCKYTLNNERRTGEFWERSQMILVVQGEIKAQLQN